jgi:hypothetical protein
MRKVLLPLALAAGLAACTGVSSGDVRLEEGLVDRSVAVLHVERTHLDPEAVEGIDAEALRQEAGARPARLDDDGRTVLRAAFARYQGLEEPEVLSLLGIAGLEAPTLPTTLPDGDGSCRLAEADPEALPVDAQVDLLDVGELHVAVGESEAHLAPRSFPDLASVLAGVVYAGDAALTAPSPGDAYLFRADGGFEVEAFEAEVPAPVAVEGLSLVGADGTGVDLEPGSRGAVEMARTGAVSFYWATGEDAGAAVEVEVMAGETVLTCVARDEGQLTVPAELVSALSADEGGRLRVRRVEVAALVVPGIERAYARATSTRLYALRVR